MTEGEDMRVEFERTRINLWHVGVILFNTFALAAVWVNMTRDVQDVKDTQAETSKTLTDMQMKLSPLDTWNFRLQQNEAKTSDLGTRMDRFVEIMGIKLDTLNENVSAVRADVRVLSQKVDQSNATAKSTTFRTQ